MQPEFIRPDFMDGTSADDIHRRMMAELPDDIDDMPCGFPYDMTRPTAIEKSELINFHLLRALMIAYPQYAWDEWLDLHGQQVHLTRHEAARATGVVTVTGSAGTELPAGTVFCTTATNDGPSIEFQSDADAVIPEGGSIDINVTAVEAGTNSNVKADTVILLMKPINNITSITNKDGITGGTERETDDDFYDRIAVEYSNSMTYLGNDTDYKRWAKEAGAGDCIVDPAWKGPGTVRLVLVDGNGQPANKELINAVFNHIVSPADRAARLLPTGCAELTCAAATTVSVNYTCTGLIYDSEHTSIEEITAQFEALVKTKYEEAKANNVLRYNDIRPLLADISGVTDFSEFMMNGSIHQLEIAIGTARYDCAEEVRLVLVACVGIQQVLHKLLDLRFLPDVLALVFRDDVECTERRIDALIGVPDIGLPHDFVPPVLIS